ATDAAALAAAAALAGSDFRTPTTAHNGAMAAAKTIYRSNDIFGTLLTNPVDGDPNGATPQPGSTVCKFRFLDPNNNDAEVPIGDENGKVIEISVVYGYKPMWGQFLGLKDSVYPIRVLSRGGVPDLDVVLCFDITGSMDDATKVSIVDRRWDPDAMSAQNTKGRIFCDVKKNGVLSDIGFFADRVVEPQWPMTGDLTYNTPMRAVDLNLPAAGQPPGNCPPGTA